MYDTRIMTPFGREDRGCTVDVDRLLLLKMGSHRFKGDARDDGHAVADACLNASRKIGSRSNRAVFVLEERVIVLRSQHRGASEAAPNLKAFGRWD